MGRFKNKADMIDSISNEAKVSVAAAKKVLTNRTLETVIYLETKLAVANAIIAEKKKHAEALVIIASKGVNPFNIKNELGEIDTTLPLQNKKKKALSKKQLSALKKGRKKLNLLRKERKKNE